MPHYDKERLQQANVSWSSYREYKKPNADLTDVKNYRPISNRTFASKLIETEGQGHNYR